MAAEEQRRLTCSPRAPLPIHHSIVGNNAAQSLAVKLSPKLLIAMITADDTLKEICGGGQRRRRPAAGEGYFNQVSQEDVLEEATTTGPPPDTFAAVRRAQQKQKLEGEKTLPTS